jgi:tRNA-dihydrouridine synthase B
MRIGDLDIQRALLLAPMEDVTDQPFRILAKRLGADVVYTEFVNADELARGGRRAERKLTFRDEERPLGVQLYGADAATMAEAARIVAAHGPDLIDINCGCWVRDVAQRGAGAGLLRDLPQLRAVAEAVVRAVDIPVTLKTRLGWDAGNITILDVARICEESGIRAITVHCRTRAQGFGGEADLDWIPRLKAATKLPIIANGDLATPQDIARAFDDTGCDGVMIGRGAIRDPWIFQTTRTYLATGKVSPPPDAAARLALFRTHLELAVECLGERAAVHEVRKHYVGLLRGMPHVGPVRDELRRLASPASILDHLQRFLTLYAPNSEVQQHAALPIV